MDNDKDIFNKFYKSNILKIRLANDVYEKYLNQFFNEDLKFFFEQEGINFVADLGCGDGQFEDFVINELKVKDKKFFCFDNSETAIESAINRKIANCNFIKESCLSVAENYKNYFDAVIIVNVLHHLDGLSIIEDAYKLLKPNGLFLIIDLPWENVFQKMLFKIFDFSPQFLKNKFAGDDLLSDGKRPQRYRFTKKQLRGKLQQANFSILSQEYYYLFCFLYFFVEKVLLLVKLPKKTIRKLFYPSFMVFLRLENFLLKLSFFQNQASIYKVICVKK